jgi:hypothetical protein
LRLVFSQKIPSIRYKILHNYRNATYYLTLQDYKMIILPIIE